MIDNCTIFDFDGKKVRAVWNAEQKKYYFAVVDIVQVLTDCSNVRQYLKQIRTNDIELDSKWSSICTKIEMLSPNGKRPKIEVANLDGIMCILDSIYTDKKESVRHRLEEFINEHIGEKNTQANTKKRLKVRRIAAYIIKVFILAIIPIVLLICQENNPDFHIWKLGNLDDLDVFHELYIKDQFAAEDTTVLFLDVSREMIPRQSNEDSLYYTIVNNEVLFDFLRKIKTTDNFKAVFIDVAFYEDLMSQHEIDTLISLLNNVESDPQRVYIFKERGSRLIEELDKFAVWGTYEPNAFGMYSRTAFMDFDNYDNSNSAAFQIYCSVSGKEIEPNKVFRTYGWNFFRNNPIIKYIKPHKDFIRTIQPLGIFLQNDIDSITADFSDKVIFVGDFCGPDDIHSSYKGKTKGIYSIYCEYKAMEKEQYLFSNKMLVLLFLIYVVITVIVINNRFTDKLTNLKNKLNDYIEKIFNEKYMSPIKDIIATLIALVDVFLRFGLTIFVLNWLTTDYLYYNYDFLYNSKLPLYYFTTLEVIAICIKQVKGHL